VADLTQDFSDEAFHEIHLSGKQLVFLFMATTVVSVIIFLLGVFVGRGVPAERQVQDQFSDPAATAVASAPTPAPVTASTPAPAPAPVADAGPPAAEPPVPPAETEELSYKKRLEGRAGAPERLKPAPTQTALAARAAASSSAPASAVPASQQTVIGTAQPGTWVVQVHVLRDRTVAMRIVQRLIAKNYPAFLVAAGPPANTFKVQVGRFKDRDAALKAVERLKREEQFNSWITQ
jgi:cell division septation protein DedD